MPKVFIDTYCWYALLCEREKAHSRAKSLLDHYLATAVPLYTTEEVLVELFSAFTREGASQRRRAAVFVRRVLEDSRFNVLRQSHDSLLAGLTLFEARLDKGYSLVDCISMAAMRSEGIEEVLTADKHFEQEGFRLLL